MARKQLSLDEQIHKSQEEVWPLAEMIDKDQLKNADRLLESGIVLEETELMRKIFFENLDEDKKAYLLLLNEMRKFYKKMCKQQQIEVF
jgi:hypothetical protein